MLFNFFKISIRRFWKEKKRKEIESAVDSMLLYRIDLLWDDELLFGVYSWSIFVLS